VQLLGAVNKSFKNRLKPQWRSFAKIKSIFSLDFSLVLLWLKMIYLPLFNFLAGLDI